MIQIKTNYTLEIYKEYNWFSLFRGKYYRYGIATFPFVTLLMIVCTVCSFIWFDSLFLIIVSGVGVLLCVLFYLVAYIRPKKYVKQSPSLFQSSIEVSFNDDSFSSLQTGEIVSGTGITKYEAIHKVYETKSTFYLYLTPYQAMLLTKQHVVKGTPEELRQLLQSKLPSKKYVLCK